MKRLHNSLLASAINSGSSHAEIVHCPRDPAQCGDEPIIVAGWPSWRTLDDVENYHITLRFIGDVDGRTADEIVDRLDRLDGPEFELSLNGIGSFGSKKPHSIWAGSTPRQRFMPLNPMEASANT